MDPLRRPVDAALALTVAAASGAILAQVAFRYLLNDPTVWLDEFAVLLFAWITFLGAAVVQRTDSHMAIDTFVRLLPARAQSLVFALRILATGFVLAVLFWQGLVLTIRMSFIEYPAMGISRGWLFAILPVCSPLIGYYLVRTGRDGLRRLRAGRGVFGDEPAPGGPGR